MDENDILIGFRFQLEKDHCTEDEEILEFLETEVWMCNECGAFSKDHHDHCRKCNIEKS